MLGLVGALNAAYPCTSPQTARSSSDHRLGKKMRCWYFGCRYFSQWLPPE